VCVLFAAGTLLYLAVPLLEHGENLVHEAAGWADDVKRPVFDYVREEGTEVFGSLCFLAATAVYALRRALERGRETRTAPAISFPTDPRLALLAVLVLAALGDVLMRASRIAAQDPARDRLRHPEQLVSERAAAIAAAAAFATQDRARAARDRAAGVYLAISAFGIVLSGVLWRALARLAARAPYAG
jgi:hypothetical protein